MNSAEALAELTAMTAAGDKPVLTAADLARLLARAAIVDALDTYPSAPGWVPTYSLTLLRRAAAEGWRLKAGRVVGEFDVKAGGGEFRRSQVKQHCLEMARQYGRGPSIATIATGAVRA